MPLPKFEHGRVAANLTFLLSQHVKSQPTSANSYRRPALSSKAIPIPSSDPTFHLWRMIDLAESGRLSRWSTGPCR